MASVDLATTAALVSKLSSMADDEVFQLESAPSEWRYTPSRYPGSDALKPPMGEQAYCVAYSMLYRRQKLRGNIIVGKAYVDIARGLLAQDAMYQVQLFDLRNPVTEYTAGGRGVRGGP